MVEPVAATISPVKAPLPLRRTPNWLTDVVGDVPGTLIVPALIKEPVLPAIMFTPVALVPTEFEIVPLLVRVLFEFRVTAAPAVEIATEPPLPIVMFPGLAFAAVAVATALLVVVEIVRLSASAERESTAPIAAVNRTLRFTAWTPCHSIGGTNDRAEIANPDR
jgi:hypothetical protein